MRIKLLIISFTMFSLTFTMNAQDEIFWSSSSGNGEWDWGFGCFANNGGNWYWNTSGVGNRQRPDCNGTFNIIKFDNTFYTTMNLNSANDFSVNQLLFLPGTSDRTINTNAGRRIFFQNNNGNCKIENDVAATTQTFNVDIFVNSGDNNLDINPVNGFLYFNNTITNNSNNPINIYGTQQVTFSGDIAGNPGITINNTATVVYLGVSKTYTGTTTINSGTKLKISSNQTLGNIALNGGRLEIDAGAILTISGTYTSTGGTIDNKGTIKFVGGSVTFPGNATVNNGVANTLTSIEVASSGIVTINTLLRVTNSFTVSSGTLLLGGNDLRLNNATLNIAAGGTFDNGGENQIISDAGAPLINISGTFITRDKDGFVGDNTVIPSITRTLNSGSTVEYGLAGNQEVQGITAPTYQNITFSGSGTKTLASNNIVVGTVVIKDAAILNVGNNTFGVATTNLTMSGSTRFIISGTGQKPDIDGTYNLSGGVVEFANNLITTQTIKNKSYQNVEITGTNVGNSNGNITLNSNGTFTVKSGGIFTINGDAIVGPTGTQTVTVENGGTFKTGDADGFNGATNTSVRNNIENINLNAGSTVEYSGANQTITLATYSNLTVSGTGTKTIPTELFLGNDLLVKAATLQIESNKTLIVTNKVAVNPAATVTINNSGSLIQVNDDPMIINTGNITYERNYTSGEFDYTYWSSPVASQNLFALSPETKLDKFFSFNAAANEWLPENPITETMEIGKGYIIRGVPPIPGPPVGFATSSFVGTPNNGIITTPISWNGASEGTSNLIGNPYPSAIDADKFLSLNSTVIEGTIYFWTHNTDMQLRSVIIAAGATPGTEVFAYTSDDYASYNITGGVGIAPDITAAAPSGGTGGSNNNIPNGKIAAGQAFFTTSLLANGTVTFNNSMRLGNSNNVLDNSQFFKTRNPKIKTAAIEKHRIWLNLRNTQGVFKQTLVGYITDATNEYDNRFDGISFDTHKFADFYSVYHDKNLVIQGRSLPFDENDEVPLGFRTTIDGVFTINIDQTDGVLTNQSVFIEDKLTNTIFDLRSGAYTFATTSGTFNDRFVLRYTNKTLGAKDVDALENQVLVSTKNKQIKINSPIEIIDKVTVYDLLGRQLFKKEKVNNNELAIPNFVPSQQTLIVKVSLQNGQNVTRKIVY